jgi:predicted O-methyltransferase YrrM
LPSRRIEQLLEGVADMPVTLFPRQMRQHLWAMPEHELLVLGAICRWLAPKLIIELGTYIGASGLAMTANSPPGSRLITYDVPPHTRATHQHGLGVGFHEFDVGGLFRGSLYEANIEQRFVNLAGFDGDEWRGQADLVFIDADHTYEFARHDTETAFAMLRPGGCIVWHDYTWSPENAECIGVTHVVHEVYERHRHCFQIAGTRFAVLFDRPGEPPTGPMSALRGVTT